MKEDSNLDVDHKLKTGDTVEKKLNSEDAKSLIEEVFLLEKQLEDQLVMRSALEKAFDSKPISIDDENNKNPIVKPVMDLVKEISDLESQIAHLEKHLLSLYRETFNQRIPTFDATSKHKRASSEGCLEDHYHIPIHHGYEVHENDPIFALQAENSALNKNIVVNSGVNRCPSSMSRVDPYHLLPLTFSILENSNDGDVDATSAFRPRSGHFNNILETPNWISEEMIKNISSIYSELAANGPSLDHEFPGVSFLSETDFSPSEYHNNDHMECRENPSFLNEMPFARSRHSQDSVAVMQFNYRDNQRLKNVKHKLWTFKSLVTRLERVNPSTMKHEEKLAFWINLHNALIMHAYIVYGIPHSDIKRKTSFVQKAAYIVGGQAISIEMIRNLILGCQLFTRQGYGWLQNFFNFTTKIKAGSDHHHYLRHYMVHPHENRLYFALCSGNRSDPMVRLYTPKRVFEELEVAKEDYIRANIIMDEKKQRIVLPKIVYLFSRDSHMSEIELMGMIRPFLSKGKPMKKIEWVSHNLNFRYLIDKALLK